MTERWEDPAEGMLTPQPDEGEREWREGESRTYRWEDEGPGCWFGCLIAALSAALVVGLITAVVWWLWPSSSSALDCGPEGKPALGGTACIDRYPVYVVRP